MIGSEKQIKWAEDIKTAKAKEFADLRKRANSPIADKALDFIEGQQDSRFWIEYRDFTIHMLLNKLFSPAGIMLNGLEYRDCARMSQTGDIEFFNA